MKKAILVSIIGVFTLSVNAGDWSGKAVLDDKNPKAPLGCPDYNGAVSGGYVTDYVLHGIRINRDSIWADAHYTFDAFLPITIGASYKYGIDDFFFNNAAGLIGLKGTNETDVYAKVALPEIAGFATTLGYTHRFFNFPVQIPGVINNASTGEISLGLRRDIGFADLVLGTLYAPSSSTVFLGTHGGWYHSGGIEKTIGITDSIGLVVGAGIGYHDGYFFNGSGWANYYLNAALPISLNCRTTLTPFIGYNGVQQWNQYNFQGDLLHAGASVSVAF